MNNPIRNNQTKPNQTQSRPFGPVRGISRGRITARGESLDQQELPPLEQRRAKELRFIRDHLGTEHEGMALSALIALQMTGRKPTKQAVLDRLHAQGRRSDQLREKGWMQ